MCCRSLLQISISHISQSLRLSGDLDGFLPALRIGCLNVLKVETDTLKFAQAILHLFAVLSKYEEDTYLHPESPFCCHASSSYPCFKLRSHCTSHYKALALSSQWSRFPFPVFHRSFSDLLLCTGSLFPLPDYNSA